MNKEFADKTAAAYVKKLFAFAVMRCRDLNGAEELAAQISFELYKSLLKQNNIENLDGYVYRVAKNVYARFIGGKNHFTAAEGLEHIPDNKDFTQEIINSESYGILRREITYLTKLQREIIVLYYFHDKKVREIASLLSLNENTVKWHLACSRKELKTGMEKIRTTGNLGVEPIRLCNLGHSGSIGEKGDTADFLAKVITQNIAYAAYHQPRSVNEIAEELGINPIFVEDEVAVLEEYGFMYKLKNGKYRTNILICEPNEARQKIYKEIDPKYSKLFAEKYFAPILERISEIPEWLHVPDNDINLMKWCLVCFMANKLYIDGGYLSDFYVKRPDGGDYIAFATLDIKPDWDTSEADADIYWSCGDMWRSNFSNEIWWKSWQFNCYWTGRTGGWRDNLSDDFDKIYFWLNNQLPESTANAESYARLVEKKYIVKRDGQYRLNIILCDSEKKWQEYIPEATEEIKDLSLQYAAEVEKEELIGQPKHMHDLIKCMSHSAPCALHTRVMKALLDMGVLKLPSEEQAKGLCTIMFMDLNQD